MAFDGNLIYILSASNGNAVALPNKYIMAESYSITPDQILDLDSTRDETGVLHRNALEHTATKIEIETTPINNSEWGTIRNIIENGYTNKGERKLTIKYYDDFTDSYKNANCYMPDITFEVRNIDEVKKIINYDKIKIKFIEY